MAMHLVSLLTESAMKYATECSITPGFEHRFTVSIGYHWWHGLDRNTLPEDLLRLADDNLYVVKGRGRDQVMPDKHDLIANAKNKPS